MKVVFKMKFTYVTFLIYIAINSNSHTSELIIESNTIKTCNPILLIKDANIKLGVNVKNQLITEKNNANIPNNSIFVSLPQDVIFSIYNEFLNTIEKVKIWMAGYCALKQYDCIKEYDILINKSHQFICLINYFKNIKIDIIDINSRHINDLSFENIVKNINKVEKISLKNCTMLTNRSIFQIGKFTELLSLDLSGCTQIEDYWLMNIANFCKNVNYLDISFCNLISTPCILDIIENYWKLKTLILEYTNIEEQPVFEMSKKMGIANLTTHIFPLIKNGKIVEPYKSLYLKCKNDIITAA